jgi:hypothetical protein
MKLKLPRFRDPESLVRIPYASGHNFLCRGPRLHMQSKDTWPIEANDTMNGDKLPPIEVPPCLTMQQWLEIQGHE